MEDKAKSVKFSGVVIGVTRTKEKCDINTQVLKA